MTRYRLAKIETFPDRVVANGHYRPVVAVSHSRYPPSNLLPGFPVTTTIWYEEVNQGVDTLHKLTYIIG